MNDERVVGWTALGGKDFCAGFGIGGDCSQTVHSFGWKYNSFMKIAEVVGCCLENGKCLGGLEFGRATGGDRYSRGIASEDLGYKVPGPHSSTMNDSVRLLECFE